MAKRVPAGEVPYRPLDKVLIQSVLAGVSEPEPASAQMVGGRSSAVAVLEPPSHVEPPRPHVTNPPRPSVATMPTPQSPRRALSLRRPARTWALRDATGRSESYLPGLRNETLSDLWTDWRGASNARETQPRATGVDYDFTPRRRRACREGEENHVDASRKR